MNVDFDKSDPEYLYRCNDKENELIEDDIDPGSKFISSDEETNEQSTEIASQKNNNPAYDYNL